jgi:hypothetical protein
MATDLAVKPLSKGLWRRGTGLAPVRPSVITNCAPEEHVSCMRSVATAYRTFPCLGGAVDTALSSPMRDASLIRPRNVEIDTIHAACRRVP